jgi:hypothetical protein
MFNSLDYPVDIQQVFPNEMPDSSVFWNSFKVSIFVNIPSGQPFDQNIVNEWHRDMRNFFLQDKGYISLLNLD